MVADALLDVGDVVLKYGSTAAVNGASLKVRQGESVSLIGPNGSGKSTLLSAICGLMDVTAGSIRYQGASVAGRAPEQLVREGLVLVPEGRQIFTTMTVGENLRLPTARLRKADAAASLDRELQRFPALKDRMQEPAGNLSGGQQQQLAIARALLSGPKLLLLDEPSLGLAPKIVDDVFDLLAQLKADGVTILLVEQNAIRASRFADRTYVLAQGRIGFEGGPDELLDTDVLADSYLGAVGRPAEG